MADRRRTEIVGEETWAGAFDNPVLHPSQSLFLEKLDGSSLPPKPHLPLLRI